MQGRLAVYVSLAFIVLSFRLPFWSAYLEVLNQSRLIREFVLRNDVRRHVTYRTALVDSPAGRKDMELQQTLSGAMRRIASDQYAQAKEDYLRIIAQTESETTDAEFESRRKFHLARASNNLAWMLATCADEKERDSQQALANAKRAVQVAPEEGTYWNTLGVAYYRVQNWQGALSSLQRSMTLRHDGDSFDWFFLAMLHAKQGQLEEARQWYEKAVAWHPGDRESEQELHRFHVEAAAVLGLPAPPPLDLGPPGGTRFMPHFERGRVRPAVPWSARTGQSNRG
jgi:tetratricopeptide (TPR) repeat protein